MREITKRKCCLKMVYADISISLMKSKEIEKKKLMTICEVKIHRDITESLKSQAIAFSCNCKMDLRELSYVKN